MPMVSDAIDITQLRNISSNAVRKVAKQAPTNSIDAYNGNNIYVEWCETNNSMYDVAKNEQTAIGPDGDTMRTVKVPEEVIALKSGETGYYFEVNCKGSDYIQVFFITKKNNTLCSFRCSIPNEDVYNTTIDEVKAIMNTLKNEK